MVKHYIYVLHFDTDLAHAQHYIGVTTKLKERLTAHANGAGSNLTFQLMLRGIHWNLASLLETSHVGARRLERGLKEQKNASRYCGICCDIPKKFPGTTPYPIDTLDFPLWSGDLRKKKNLIDICQLDGDNPITDDFECVVGIPEDGKDITLIPRIMELMRNDKDALGFIPAGDTGGIVRAIRNRELVVVRYNGSVVGYTVWTKTLDQPFVNIMQCVVADEHRGKRFGYAMIDWIAYHEPNCILTAWVRSDLAANLFWHAIGFDFIGSKIHRTSGHLLNNFVKQAVNGV